MEQTKSVPYSEAFSFQDAICTENMFGFGGGVLISQDVFISQGCYSIEGFTVCANIPECCSLTEINMCAKYKCHSVTEMKMCATYVCQATEPATCSGVWKREQVHLSICLQNQTARRLPQLASVSTKLRYEHSDVILT
jgi:hypothetical protein